VRTRGERGRLIPMKSGNLTKCPVCGGDHLISDDSGTYCASCRHILDSRTDIHFYTQKPTRIAVRWSDHRGYIRLTNPVSGEVAEIVAKRLDKKDRWIFDRLNEGPKEPNRTP